MERAILGSITIRSLSLFFQHGFSTLQFAAKMTTINLRDKILRFRKYKCKWCSQNKNDVEALIVNAVLMNRGVKQRAAKHIHTEDTVHFTGSTHRAFVTNKSHNEQLNSDSSFLITTPRYNGHSLNVLCVLRRVAYLSLDMNLRTFGQI